ncbi:MAG: aminopeptidase [Lachnospiraceae bacterium]|nr:aminopeptidase [Lachnospiraceae bacterium]
MDERMKTLAHNLVTGSCQVQSGERVYVEYIGADTTDLARQVIKEVYAAGGLPYVHFTDPRVQREIMLGCTREQLVPQTAWECDIMAQMDCYIGIRGSSNLSELSDVPDEKSELYATCYQRKVTDIRVNQTRWVVLRYPNDAMAQNAGTSREAFEDFYYQVCNVDYRRMAKAMEPLVTRMNRTDRVRIVGPGTDLRFSLRGMEAIPCAGEANIPDGEVYSAPVRDSVEGVITYNTPSIQNGFTFEQVKLTFEKGKIVDAQANDTARIQKIFDMDEGAHYVGEFALGVNPYVTKPMKDILFDEKIQGSFHFTPGNAYEDADNGNRSALHWDLVCIQTPENGGGEIWFDDELIRKDGRFVVPDLEGLNPENLA